MLKLNSFNSILSNLEQTWGCSTLSTNYFSAFVKKHAVNSYKDGSSLCFDFADGSSLSCESLDPFNCKYAVYVSADLSLVRDLAA